MKILKAILVVGLAFIIFMVALPILMIPSKVKKSRKAHCLNNQYRVYLATRIYIHDYLIKHDKSLNPGDPFEPDVILEIANLRDFRCASGGKYTWLETLPEFHEGELKKSDLPVSCSHVEHQPTSTENWWGSKDSDQIE